MTSNRFAYSLILSAAAALFTTATAGAGGLPRLARLTPPGGQRGTTVEVEFFGRGMETPKEVLFYEPGITVESLEVLETIPGNNGRPQPVEAGTRVKAKLKIAENCTLGPIGVRLRTLDGLTEYQRFFVGAYPTVEENETTLKRNNTPDTATALTGNSTVFGRLNDGPDVDFFRIEVKKGDRVSAEIEAARLGVERGIPDLHMAIYDPNGKKLVSADDSALYIQDPLLSVLAEQNGAYLVEVRHCMFNGQGEMYRLHVGTFPRPTGVYPAGGPIGTEQKVRILGDPRGAWEQSVRLPSAPGDVAFVAVDPNTGATAPSPNTMRASPFANVLEMEPNDSPESMANAEVTDLPVAFNGIIDKIGDVDCFRFRAKKGQQFRFHALAQELGSPVDPAIWIRAVNGRTNAPIARSNDSRPNQLGLPPANGLIRTIHDAILEFTVPVDGEYILGIEDERGQGGSDHVYRIEAAPLDNAVYTYIVAEPDNRFNPQVRQAIAIPAGNSTTVQVAVFTTSRPFSGELELVGVNLPKGVTIQAPKITPGMNRVPVVFTATADAKPQVTLADLIVRPVGSSETSLTSGYRQTITMNQYGNNDFYLHTTVSKLAVAVGEPAPYRVEVDEPKSSLVQNGEMTLKFRVVRDAGYTGAVTVQMEWKPNGVIAAVPITIKAGETEAEYQIGAARNATAGTYEVNLTGMSGEARRGYGDGGGRAYVSTKPFKLTIAEPHVEGRIGRASVERGKTATIVCKLNHLQPFEGKAKATLYRLPRGVELVEAQKDITSKDTEVSFTIKATSDALVGNYQGIVLDVTVQDNGQSVRQLSGSGMLRIDTERGGSAKK